MAYVCPSIITLLAGSLRSHSSLTTQKNALERPRFELFKFKFGTHKGVITLRV